MMSRSKTSLLTTIIIIFVAFTVAILIAFGFSAPTSATAEISAVYWGMDDNGVFTLSASSNSVTPNEINYDEVIYGKRAWDDRKSEIKSLKVSGSIYMYDDLHNWFEDCINLTTVDLRGADFSAVRIMTHTFSGCNSLESIDLSMFDTSDLRYVDFMFAGCYNLVSVDLSGLNFSKVVKAGSIFESCDSLYEIKTPASLGDTSLRTGGKFWDGEKDISTITKADVNKTLYRHSKDFPGYWHSGTDDNDCTTPLKCSTCGYTIKAAQTAAVQVLSNGSVIGQHTDIEDAFAQANGESTATVKMLADVSAEQTLTIESGKNITLDLNGYKLTHIGSGEAVRVLGTFTLDDSNKTRRNSVTYYTSETQTATATVSGGVITGGKDCCVNVGRASGETVSNVGTFIMNGGNISGNRSEDFGGGIYVSMTSTAKLYGGSVSYNYANIYGGGVRLQGASMYIGDNNKESTCEISHNTAKNDCGGIDESANYDCTVYMNGGKVSYNTALNYTIGGICAEANTTLTIKKGEISNNSAPNATAGNGGGLCIKSNKAVTIENAVIKNNTAGNIGGGMFVDDNCTVNMTNCTITGNSAKNGGGVYVAGTLNMTGCTIGSSDANKNTASSSGGGVYVNGNFSIKGNTNITYNKQSEANDNVYLSSGKKINVNGALSGAQIGVKLASGSGEIATGFTSTNNPSGSKPSVYFISDDSANDCVYATSGTVTIGTHSGGTATCVEQAACSQCGVKYGSVDGINHDFTGDYISSNQGHWHECQREGCDVAEDIESHTPSDNDGDCTVAVICTVCGYEITPSQTAVAQVTFNGKTTKYATFAAAWAYANDLATTTTTTATVKMLADAQINSTLEVNRYITLDLNGCMLKKTGSTGSVIYINSGGSFTLTDSEKDLPQAQKTEHKYIISTNEATKGLLIFADDGAETLYGGVITGGTGSPLGARYCGGGVYVDGGTFTMGGGTIAGNKVAEVGGGVALISGICTMTGGKISGNKSTTGGGVFVNGGKYTISDTAEISGNTTEDGGGVYIIHGTFTMNGGTIASNSSYNNGGGVYAVGGTFTMSSTAEISGNKASFGGGVCVLSDGWVKMVGGSIKDNEAKYSEDGCCGGVVIFGGTFIMEGGEISGNTAASSVGGVLVADMYVAEISESFTSLFRVSGAVVITGNKVGENESNVCLINGSKITVAAALTDGTQIGVTHSNGSGDVATGFTYNGADKPSVYFIPDDSANNCVYVSADTTGTVTIGEHNEVTDAAVPATCTENGKTEGSHCSMCSKVLVAQTEIPSLGHDFDTEWTQDTNTHYHACKNGCGEKQSEGEHNEVTDAAVPATCTENGKTEGSHCSMCSKVLVAQTEIPLLGHDFDTEWTQDTNTHYHACKNSGCEETKDEAEHDYTEGVCKVCGMAAKLYWGVMYKANHDGNGYVLTLSSYISGAAYFEYESDGPDSPWFHYASIVSYVAVDRYACAPQSTAYWFREFGHLMSADLRGLDTSNVTDMRYMFYGCGSLNELYLLSFEIAEGTNVEYIFYDCVSLKKIVTPKTIEVDLRLPNDGTWWNFDRNSLVTEYITSDDQGHTVYDHTECTPTAQPVRENEVSATCSALGSYDEVFYCSVCHAKLSTESYTTDKDPDNHRFGQWQNEAAANCTHTGTKAHKDCIWCDKHFGSDNFEITDLTIPTNDNHSWNDGEVTKQSTCTEVGEKTFTCNHNSAHTKKDSVPTKAHTEVIDEAVAATCTETGKTEGKHCSVCDTVLAEQTVTDAIGHSFGEWTVVKEATIDEEGEERRVCANDSTHYESRALPKLVPENNGDQTPQEDVPQEDVPQEELSQDGLSAGAIAGIAVGVIVLVLLVTYVASYFALYRKGIIKGKFFDVIYAPMNMIFKKKQDRAENQEEATEQIFADDLAEDKTEE